MTSSGVRGPFFVSMGSPEQLKTFLGKNPTVPRDNCFVDTSLEQDAYAALKFRKDFSGAEGADIKMKMPSIDWMAYLSNVASLAPKPAKEGEFPEGVKKQGGTFVIQGDKILFVSADRIPGDEPSVAEVLRAAGA